jgi:N-acetylglutamate synthase-like GNAT family acetyltransferase
MNSNYQIREASEYDVLALCDLMLELSGSPISMEGMIDRLQMIERSRTDSIFVYEQDSTIWGVLVFRIRENIREVSRFGEVCVIVVKSEAKRCGVGRRLMDFAELKSRELGCKATYLVSGFARKDEAHQFYQELGYEITGYRFVKQILAEETI